MLRNTLAGPGLRNLLAAGLLLAGLSGASSADSITFELDDAGIHDSPFQSAESNGVFFSANLTPLGFRGELFVSDTAGDLLLESVLRTAGNALFVLPAEEDAPIATNVLFMLFRNPVESLSLKFGGISVSSDSLFAPPPSGTVAGLIVGNIGLDDALTLDEVGRAIVPLDDDPAASQVIAVGAPGGLPFDFAVFGLFVDANESLTPADAIEVVDDVNFETATAVPEPGSLTLFATLIGLGLLPTTIVATRRPPRRDRQRFRQRPG